MVYELERVLRVCNGFLCSISVTYDGNKYVYIYIYICSIIRDNVAYECFHVLDYL